MLLPRETPHLIGHEAAELALAAAAASARLHHAWLLGGPRGIGKATLAYRFARWLLAAPAPTSPPSLMVPPSHGAFRRVAADTHADLLTVELAYDPQRKRMRTEITTDDARGVADFLRLTPAEGGWRVVIVDGAEAMNRIAANALLKILEEPPARAVLLLVSHAPGALLPTLRSRCRSLSLAPLPGAALTALLAQHLPDRSAAEHAQLAALADGSLGRALALAGAETLGYADLAADILNRLPAMSVTRMHEVADQVLRADGGFATFLELLRRTLAGAIRAEAAGQPTPLGGRLAALRPLPAWSEAWQAIGELARETEEFYMDKRQAIVNALQLIA